jgi:hypothetical protein
MTPVAQETDRTQIQLMLRLSESLTHLGVVPLNVALAAFDSLPSACDVLCTEILILAEVSELSSPVRQNVMN